MKITSYPGFPLRSLILAPVKITRHTKLLSNYMILWWVINFEYVGRDTRTYNNDSENIWFKK